MDQEFTRRNFGMVAAGAAMVASVGVGEMADAQAMAGNWFAMIKAQHRELNRKLMAVKAAGSHMARVAAFKSFANYLAAHSIAEETSIYPALAITGSEAASKQLYNEQDDAKVLVARINDAFAMNQDSQAMSMINQLGNALNAHVAEEENQKFPALMAHEDAKMNAMLTREFSATFNRASGNG